MKRLLPILLLLPASACRCSGSTSPPPSGLEEVTIAGRVLQTQIFFAGLDRARVPDLLRGLGDDGAALVGFSRERHIHLYGDAAAQDYDVLFLDAGRKVVETAALPRSSLQGATASVPSKYALLLRSGWVRDRGTKPGDPVGFSPPLSSREPEPLPVLEIGGHRVSVELARNVEQYSRGLMHRRHMGWDDGMLFCYPGPEESHSFWMRNTRIPLDIAFLRTDGTLLNVVETPVWKDPEHGDEQRSVSAGPCRYVLELNLGWFRKHGFLDGAGMVKPGTRVDIPEAWRTD